MIMMNEFTTLTRPSQCQIIVDISPKQCLPDGFNYPTFRLLNKQARVAVSMDALSPNPSTFYRLFAISNIKGWFTAVTSSSIVFSPLHDLRLAFNSPITPFSPKRSLSLAIAASPTLIAYASADTKLVVAFDGGQLAVYDTSALFTPGSELIHPLHSLETHSGPFRQIAPNPGTEPGIVDTLAVVRADGCVQLFNSNLESQGGWAASDIDSTPVTVAWSPKGKHLALGLSSGDILTFAPSSPSSPQKHIPPTTSAPLTSLTWLAPGHTFRTSYAPAPNSVDPVQHILSLDIKSSALTYAAPNHPFALPDRTQQSFVVILPRWDEDGTAEKTLMVVADKSSTDIEILGSSSGGWHQQWQENQLALPLDKSTSEDTVLLALDVDLTDASGDGVPVMYAYLNDGTVEAWSVEGVMPYTGMVRPISPATSSFSQPTPASPFAQPPPFSASTTSAFAQPVTTSAFGQPGFGSGNSSGFGTTGFGQTPTFGQTSSPSAFNAPFGQSSQPAPFGLPASTATPDFNAFSSFGGASTSNAFGTAGAFGSGAGNAFGGSSNAFGSSTTSSPFGKPSGAFGSLSASTNNVFGKTSFGFGSSPSPSTSPSATAQDMSREASMRDDTSFGGLSLSLGDNDSGTSTTESRQQKPGIFGSFSPPAAPTTTTFGGGGELVKPAAGFGAFGNLQGSSSPSADANTNMATGTDQKPSSAFGQSSFGQSSFGKPSFGQSGFGQSGFGQSGFGAKPVVSVPASMNTGGSDGFSAFAAGTTGFGNASGGSGGGGFAAFSSGMPSAFGQQQQNGTATTASSPFASTQEPSKSPFGAPASTALPSPFGAQLQPSTSFRETSPQAKELTPQTPTKPLPLPVSPSSSPGPSLFEHDRGAETKGPSIPSASPFGSKPSGGGAFGNLTSTPSAFKPASGFGAFGSDATPNSSPFFKPKSNEAQSTTTTPASVSAFPSLPALQPQSQSSAPSTTPAFGAPSSLGAFKSVFASSPPAPVKPPSVGGFEAFSGSTGGFSAVAGQKKSFGELLKAGDGDKEEKEKEPRDPVKPSASAVFGPEKGKVKEVKVEVKKEEKEDGEITEDMAEEATEPVKPTTAVPEKPADNATEKSLTPEVATPIVSSKPVPTLVSSKEPFSAEADKEKPDKGLFTSKIPVPIFPSISTPSGFGDISNKGTATPKSNVKEEITSSESTPKAPISVFSPPPKDISSSEGESGKGKGKAVEKNESSATVSEETSFGSLSLLSEASSFVQVEGEGQDEEESPSNSDSDSEHGDDQDESSEGSSFLSDSYVSDESPEEDQESEEEEEEEDSPEPTAIPLPESRSSSATPQPELPSIHVTPSPSDSPEPGMLPTIPEEESTTPPGTPIKEQPPLKKSPSPSPAPASPPLFGVGLGRPSTRPTRSSPLASTPVSLEDDEEQEVMVPSPQVLASPKPRFAVLPMPPPSPDKPGSEESSKISVSKLPPRPKTPPLLSFGSAKPATTPATPAPSPSTLPPKATSVPPTTPLFGSLFGKPASPPVFGSVQNVNNQVQTAPAKSSAPSTASGFSSKSIFPPPITLVAPPSFGMFGTPPQVTTPPPQTAPAPSGTGFGLSPFGLKGSPSATPASPVPNSLFGGPLSTPATPAPTATPPTAVITPPPIASMEEGMQKECALLFLSLNKELEDLRFLAQQIAERRVELSKSAGGSRGKADLGDGTKWNLGDVVQFGQVLKQYEQDLSTLQELRDAQYRALRELQSNMLKASTRREEIARFNKAKNDSEFAKMLKSRTLGPEHLETQTQLRRNIRAMRDRIQKLEDHLHASKKKLAEVNSGKLCFRAPSLDTINRTYRNIDMALQHQADDMARLTARISKLTIKNPGLLKSQHPARDARLPDAVRRPYNVTPHVAVTTAAALNAERSAHELKRALLAIRKEPLLNMKAAVAPPPPSGFKSPQKILPPPNFYVGFSTPIRAPLLSAAQGSQAHSTSASVPDWTLPEDNFNPSTPPAARRGAGVTKRQHMSVPLKKSAGNTGPAPSPPAAAKFDWGPLPVFEQAQGTTMVEAVRLTPPSNSKPLAGGSSFGGWNVGLFGKQGK